MPRPSRKSSRRDSIASVLDQLDEILGTPPLPVGRDHAKYRALQSLFVAEIRPRDLLEAYWVRGIVHNVWRANLTLHAQRAVLKLARADAIAEIRTKYTGNMLSSEQFVAAYLEKPEFMRDAFRAMMKKTGFREKDLQALGFYHGLASYEDLERSAENANKQIASIYRDIERRRDEVTARRLREAATAIEEAAIADDEETIESDGDEAWQKLLRRRL